MTNKTKTVTVKLHKPFQFEGEKITQLDMHEPLVADVMPAQSMGDTAAESEVHVFAALTRQPFELIYQMHMKDYLQLQTEYNNFLA